MQQDLSLLQVGSVETFGEPVVERCQQSAGCRAPALLLPKSTQAYRSPAALWLWHADGGRWPESDENNLQPRRGRGKAGAAPSRDLKEHLALESIKLRLVDALL